METTKNYANHIGYSDVNPFEIVRRVSDKTIDIRAMEAVRDESWKPDFVQGGFCGRVMNQNQQRWVISSKLDARIVRIRNGKRGWRDAGGNRYKLADKPVKFYDYNF
jgi:hypothetical protein